MAIVPLAIALLIFLTSSAFAGKRVALVIGNATYLHAGELRNPKNDAADTAAAMRRHGFQVIEGFDLSKSFLEAKIRTFAEALAGAEAGVFYYAGHGLQVAGKNYLVPVDAKLMTASALDFEMVSLDLVQRTMERETNTNILFLDACRDNPLKRNLARAMGTRSGEIGSGLASVDAGIGTLISFSTQPGNVALDGEGRNSPFTEALKKHLAAPKEDLGAILIAVRNDVMKGTERRQVPWEHSSLTSRFYFTPPTENIHLPAIPSGPPQVVQISPFFTPDDQMRVVELAKKKKLPLPDIEIKQPAREIPDDMRRFVGVWISDTGFEGTGRQYALIVTDVFGARNAAVRTLVGPPQPKTTILTPPSSNSFVGIILGSKLTINGRRTETVAVLSAQNRLIVTETWKDSGRVSRVVLKPVWTLVEAERTAKR